MSNLIDRLLAAVGYGKIGHSLHPAVPTGIGMTLLTVILGLAMVAWTWRKKTRFLPRGKHCYITGGSSGLGKSVARSLLERGAKVTLVARRQDLLEETKAEFINDGFLADHINILSADVTDAHQAQATLAQAEELFKVPPEYIFTCAGASQPGLFVEQPVEQFESGMQLNYFGTLYTVKAAVQRMTETGVKGKIVMVSSTLGLLGMVGYTQYAPTKHALRGLAECMRQELILYDIDVHLYFVSTIKSPGFDEEEKTKPAVTKAIEGAAPLDSTPAARAKALIKGLEANKFFITSNLLTEILLVSTIGISPRENIFVDLVLLALGWLIAPLWRAHADSQVRQEKTRRIQD